MTNETAHAFMEDLQRIFTQYRFMFSDKLAEANGMAILALEKQMEQKKGKWIECERVDYTQFHPDYSSFYSVFRCTSCLKANYRKEKYCPNCGAQMEGQDG